MNKIGIMESSMKIVIVLISLFSLFSCVKKAKFSAEELSWTDVYKENDILIFQEIITKKLDTTIIVERELYHPKYDWFSHNFTIPHTFHLYYKNDIYKKSKGFKPEMIEMYKLKTKEKTYPSIQYLGQIFWINQNDLSFNTLQLELTKKRFEKVYVLHNKKHRLHKPIDDYKPQALYWDKEYGIIRYETFGGEIWERINW